MFYILGMSNVILSHAKSRYSNYMGWLGYDAIEIVQSAEPEYKVFTPAEILTIMEDL